MDQNNFVRIYFAELAKKFAPYGYDPTEFIDAILAGIASMTANDGSMTNESAFWNCFTQRYGEDGESHREIFEDFYRVEFDRALSACSPSPLSRKLIDHLHAHNVRTVLATNPVFPAIATQKRMQWAGVSPNDFILYTTYENARHCKPSLDYYRDILQTIGVRAEDCLMVGNDVGDDMVAEKLGMKVFLLTDCLINPSKIPVDTYPNGSFDALLKYLNENLI